MKTILMALALFSFTILASNANSQSVWTTRNSTTTENINDLQFVNANYGYAVANNGKMLRTYNQGTTWFNVAIPNITNNLAVFFTNTNTGYVSTATLNYIFKTTNGGTSWTTQTTIANQQIISIKFPSASSGWAGDVNGDIIKTTNAGVNWNVIGYAPGKFTKIFAFSTDRIWIADSYGYVTYTTNSGNNFSSVKVSANALNSLYFVSTTQGYAAGDNGRVYQTTNGGANWTLLNTGTTANLKSITGNVVNSIVRLWAVGAGGKIIESYNGGATWFQQTNGTADLNVVAFPSANIGIAAGNGGRILYTNITNNVLPSCIGADIQTALYPFSTTYMDGRTDILFTAAEILQSGANLGNVIKISFNFATQNGYALNGFKVKMQNTAITSLTGFVNSGWTMTFDGVYVVYATGWQDIVLQTPFYWDGGSNLLIEICYNNSTTGSSSNVYSSTATGMTWAQYQSVVNMDGCVDLTAGTLRTLRPNICFAIQPVSGTGNGFTGIPKDYLLYQNYPNPFNPNTKIRFDVPIDGNARLNVYDLLGKEVAMLVNETKKAGSYIVDFNGSNLSSGLYFYKLQTGSYTDVKRMILIR
ncbi:T9SS C-terminal target domain-containing protein [bacterium]|nr:MAG: T9SS C-terminal target domain-containing protein [bacterium]